MSLTTGTIQPSVLGLSLRVGSVPHAVSGDGNGQQDRVFALIYSVTDGKYSYSPIIDDTTGKWYEYEPNAGDSSIQLTKDTCSKLFYIGKSNHFTIAFVWAYTTTKTDSILFDSLTSISGYRSHTLVTFIKSVDAASYYPRTRGIYDPNSTYVWDTNYRDFVLYTVDNVTSMYAVLKEGVSFSAIAPTDSTYWEKILDNYEVVISNTVIADNAQMGGFYLSKGNFTSVATGQTLVASAINNEEVKIANRPYLKISGNEEIPNVYETKHGIIS